MTATRLLDRETLEKRLSPYKCRCVQAYPSGLEIWETGWKEPFTLWAENGKYDEWLYFKLLGGIIAQTMPPSWNGNGNGGK
jgi:hypothetical protein